MYIIIRSSAALRLLKLMSFLTHLKTTFKKGIVPKKEWTITKLMLTVSYRCFRFLSTFIPMWWPEQLKCNIRGTYTFLSTFNVINVCERLR